MSEHTEVKTISRIDRESNSTNGNPRYLVTFADGTSARTLPDGAVGYEIQNSEWTGKPIRVTFNGRGNVTQIDEEN